jgi:phosphatidylinositol alpha-1,6-mannosyltransferase
MIFELTLYRRVKALLISGSYYPPQVGGISHFMEQLASNLGPDHICCLTGVKANETPAKERMGPSIYRSPSLLSKSKIIKAKGLALALTLIMIRERPQVIVLASIDDSNLGLRLHRLLGLPLLVFAHGNEILSAIREQYSAPYLALRTATRVLAASRYTADLVQHAGVDPRRIAVVHPGCDTSVFHPRPARPELRQRVLAGRAQDRIILTVGNLVWRKGHDMVIRALAVLRGATPDLSYLIVGDGPSRSELERLAVNLGLRDRVIFLGKVPDEDLPDIYALADVFVMPSREGLAEDDVEGFGIVFLEANACGKPAVGGRSGGIPEALVDGVTGLLVDPHNPEEIAAALSRLLTNRDLAESFGKQGRLRAIRDFSWAQVAERVLAIIEVARDEA